MSCSCIRNLMLVDETLHLLIPPTHSNNAKAISALRLNCLTCTLRTSQHEQSIHHHHHHQNQTKPLPLPPSPPRRSLHLQWQRNVPFPSPVPALTSTPSLQPKLTFCSSNSQIPHHSRPPHLHGHDRLLPNAPAAARPQAPFHAQV